jgi:putative copper resistance protein D
MSLLTTVNKFLLILSSFTSIGVLLSFAFLLIESEGKLQNSAEKLRKIGFLSTLMWAGTSLLQIILTLANILDSKISGALDATTLKSFVLQIDLGRFLLAQFIIAIVIVFAVTFVRTALQSIIALGLALLG